MTKINNNLININKENSFKEVTRRVNEYKNNNKNSSVISLGVGDVSKPINEKVASYMHDAVNELSKKETFKGYGYYFGHDFLKEDILENEYKEYGFSLNEIYISNGTKSDITNILELFDINSKILITDPMYPVYESGALSLNRKVQKLNLKEENNFIAIPPQEKYDLIYICSPNNPLGIAYNYEQLNDWVEYALKNDSVILFDNVYHSFIRNNDIPKSIYEIKNAKKVAIEFRSFSKRASFTGVRCSYYVIPNEITLGINDIWQERTINRFNGAGYVAQKGASATYNENVVVEINKNIEYYLKNAKMLKEAFIKLDFKVWGGEDSPFLWVKTKNKLTSWQMFSLFLEQMEIVIIPGIIFGLKGDNCFRVSALGERKNIIEAIKRMENYYEKRT